jgi:serine/threonine-protein kinase
VADIDNNATAPSTLGAADRYLVQRELGRGMMGVVYEALDTVLGRTVAVKTIELAFTVGESEREDFERRFFTEARVAANLSHPGIVVCHDVGKDPGSGKLFIVFEHLKGQTLGERVAAGPIPWRESVSIVARLARAIHHAHTQRVIHRDLKPANVMLLEPGEPGSGRDGETAVKIMDFGVAKVESLVRQLTAAGLALGSPLYMSPEQVLGQSSNARSDIFSLGSVLCTALLGRGWFEAPSMPAILARVIHDDPPVVSAILRGLPAALDRILARSMAKRPEERYPTAAAMADDLEDVLAGRTPRHTGDGTPLPGSVPHPDSDDPLLSELTSLVTVDPAATQTGNVLADLVEGHATTATRVRAARRRSWLLYGVSAAALAGFALVAVTYRTLNRGTTIPPTDAALATPTPTRAEEPIPRPTEATLPPTTPRPLAPSPEGRTEAPAPPPAAAPTGARRAGAKPTPAAAPTPTAEPVVTVAAADTPAPVRSHIKLAVEHSLENGRLIVWVDGVLALETPLRAETAKNSGRRLERVLDVDPGRHEVKVEVSWDEKRRLERQIVDVAPKTTCRLSVRLGGLIKGLGLEWMCPAP